MPGVSFVKGVDEAVNGRDRIANEEIGKVGRVGAGFGVVASIVPGGKVIAKGVTKAARKLFGGVGDEIAERVIKGGDAATEGASSTGKVAVESSEQAAGAAKSGAAGSINLMESGDAFLRNASRRADVDAGGFLDVVMHGNSKMVEIGGKLVNHRVAARVIQNNPQFAGQNIRLLSCNTGACPTGFAQNLSNKLGVNVMAPDNYIWAFPNGSLSVMGGRTIGSGATQRLIPVPSQPGSMNLFTPGAGR
jgi:filamentous hemagglutinin